MQHPSLSRAPSNLIGGAWASIPGEALASHNPARSRERVWAGSPSVAHVDDAVRAARRALAPWSRCGLDARARVLRRFQTIAAARADGLAELLCDEVGKVMWDAKAEAGLLASKVDITLDATEHGAMRRVASFDVSLTATRTGRCEFRPHGVVAVLGPFNFPAHLPNGHIVPALAMGNTVVMKPSDKAPGVGQWLVEVFDEACRAEGAPAGVINLVQGGADVASALVRHDDVDAILFTGSWPVGRRIMEANLDRPGRLLALEMGGNNPAIILSDADLRQAVVECVRSAFITSGQRCTCTRRVIVHEGVAQRVIPALCKAASALIIGEPRATHPVFIGPVISGPAREGIVRQTREIAASGGEVLVPLQAIDGAPGAPEERAARGEGWYVTPGVVRVERFVRGGDPSRHGAGADVEVFGPLLRVSIARDLDDAIEQANATDFGLAASIFTKDERAIDKFLHECRAGCLNVNTGTAGASSKLPFGGLGRSGNHRPAGAFSLDYCAYPVGSMVERSDAAQMPAGMRFDAEWVRV
jgi:succinylglutamic semialdehyde dehydrogenase